MIEIGFGDIDISKWSMDYSRMPNCAVRVLGDTATAIPELTRLCRERIAADPAIWKTGSRRASKRSASATMRCSTKWAADARKD